MRIRSTKAVREFSMEMDHRPCAWLRLPDSFAMEMADRVLLGLWVRADDCYNSPTWVATEFTPTGFMFLKHGWKSFALACCLKKGQVLLFEYDGAAMLFMKIFGITGCRLKCCMESDEIDSPGDVSPSDGSGSSGGSPSVKSEDEDSD